MKPSTTHDITRRDVIYRAIRHRLTRVACLDTCRFLRRWTPTRRCRCCQSRRRLHASSSARPTAPCTTTTTTARRRIRHASTARRHVPPSRVVTSQLRAALAKQRAAQSFKFKMSVAKHQACFTTKLQGQNLATFSHSAVMPIAYLQHTQTKHALITR